MLLHNMVKHTWGILLMWKVVINLRTKIYHGDDNDTFGDTLVNFLNIE